MKTYEAMFLLDSGHASAHWGERVDEIKGILQRHGAEIIRLTKWDDRRLAYPIRHYKRGTYVLCYYRAPRETNVRVERDVQLSDNVLRVLIIRREKMTEEQMMLRKVPSGDADIIGRIPEPVAAPKDAAADKADAPSAVAKDAAKADAPSAAPKNENKAGPAAAPEADNSKNAVKGDVAGGTETT